MRTSTFSITLALVLVPLTGGCTSPASSGDEAAAGTDSDTDSDTDIGVEGDDSPYPPGCSDGGGFVDAIVHSDTEIRITSTFAGCGNPEEVGRHCSSDDFEYVLHFDAGIAAGTYDLADPDSGVTYQRTRYWDHDQSDEGCFCDGQLDDAPIPYTSGTVTIEATDVEGYVWSLEMAGEGLHPFTGGMLLPEPCE